MVKKDLMKLERRKMLARARIKQRLREKKWDE
jgi:hypothetical protein